MKFSVPSFVQNLNFCQFGRVLDHFGHFKFDSIFELSVPDFLLRREILEIGPRFQVFLANFLLRMRLNCRKTTSGQIFNPKFETPMGCFLFDYEFWWRLLQDLCMF